MQFSIFDRIPQSARSCDVIVSYFRGFISGSHALSFPPRGRGPGALLLSHLCSPLKEFLHNQSDCTIFKRHVCRLRFRSSWEVSLTLSCIKLHYLKRSSLFNSKYIPLKSPSIIRLRQYRENMIVCDACDRWFHW